VSQKRTLVHHHLVHQILADFKNYFADTRSRKSARNWWLRIPSQLKHAVLHYVMKCKYSKLHRTQSRHNVAVYVADELAQAKKTSYIFISQHAKYTASRSTNYRHGSPSSQQNDLVLKRHLPKIWSKKSAVQNSCYQNNRWMILISYLIHWQKC